MNVEPIDPVFAAVVIAYLWAHLLYLTARDGRRRRARHHVLNSSKED